VLVPVVCCSSTLEVTVTIELEDVRRLHLDPGDVLVVRLPHRPSPEEAWHLRERLADVFPGRKALILGPGADIEVLSDDPRSGVPTRLSLTP
jgi:hypothetical protein